MNRTKDDVAAGATRRDFAVRLAAGTCAVAWMPAAAWAAVQVEEADDTAVALGYRHDTRKVDARKYPKHAATQRCNNCGLWQGAAADPWAGCAMFGRKHIAAEGWCMAWVQKPG